MAHNPETGTTTQGKTFEEALADLKEATELYLSEFCVVFPWRDVRRKNAASELILRGKGDDSFIALKSET